MPRLIVPTDKEFNLTVDSSKAERRVTTDDPIVVSFRQATEATNLKRQELLARPIRRMWEDDQYSEEFNLTPFGKRMAVDTFLTMTACNVDDPEGRKLFNFKRKGKTFEEYLTQEWGQLWPEWAEVIYTACLKVNPSWGFGQVDDENEDEEVLTLGEESAAEAAF